MAMGCIRKSARARRVCGTISSRRPAHPACGPFRRATAFPLWLCSAQVNPKLIQQRPATVSEVRESGVNEEGGGGESERAGFYSRNNQTNTDGSSMMRPQYIDFTLTNRYSNKQ